MKKKMSKLLAATLAVTMSASILTFGQGIPASAVELESLNKTEATLFVGDHVYTANTTYLNATGNVKYWVSSDESVAVVDSEGKVTAVAAGTATITAFTDTGSASCQITAAQAPDDIVFPEAPAESKKDVTPSGGWGATYPLNDSVHDPEILYVEEENCYYMLCTHNTTIRKSYDLVTWENCVRLTNGYNASTNAHAREGGIGQNAFWAPNIFYNEVMGKYCVYYSNSATLNDGGRGFGNKWSSIGMTYLEPVEGEEYSMATLDNWKDGGIVIKSYDAWKQGGSIQSGVFGGTYKFGPYNTESYEECAPNAIDPTVLWNADKTRLFMVFGSFFEGINIVELNPETGLRFDQDTLDPDDPYYEVRHGDGINIANRGGSYATAEPLDGRRNGTQAGIEGPTIFYNEDTGYYYLIVSYDYLGDTYNMRVARSKEITGPYYDYNGFNMVTGAEENLDRLNPDTIFTNETMNDAESGWTANDNVEADTFLDDTDKTLSYDPNVGTKISMPYQFEGGKQWVAIGHNSAFINADGEWMVGSHAKNPQELHVRELLWTDEGWPVLSVSRYAGEDVDQVIDGSRVVGEFEFIIMDRLKGINGGNFNAYGAKGVKAQLNADGSVTSDNEDFTGSWRMYEANKIDVTLNGITYTGVVAVGWDWENWDGAEFVIGAMNNDGTVLWGKGGTEDSFTPIEDNSAGEFIVRAGETISVPIMIKGEDVAAFEAVINYDQSLLTLTDVVAADGFMVNKKITNNEVKINGFTPGGKGMDGDVIFGYLNFTATDTVNGVTMTKITADGYAIDSATNRLDKGMADITVTIISSLKGDVDGDGDVDIADALIALQSVSGNYSLNKYQVYAADMDDSGAIDIADVMMIMNATL